MIIIEQESLQKVKEEISAVIRAIAPFDSQEEAHIQSTLDWVASGEEIFRRVKPDIPPKHLVSYFLLYDPNAKKFLLVDHLKSGLWLPAGGHVDPGEHPTTTAEREAKEELGIQAEFFDRKPLFLTVTETVGLTAGHTDVSLWYLLKASEKEPLTPDPREFKQVAWFGLDEIPWKQSDPHMKRFVEKLKRGIIT